MPNGYFGKSRTRLAPGLDRVFIMDDGCRTEGDLPYEKHLTGVSSRRCLEKSFHHIIPTFEGKVLPAEGIICCLFDVYYRGSWPAPLSVVS
jgi:hypothetical protein